MYRKQIKERRDKEVKKCKLEREQTSGREKLERRQVRKKQVRMREVERVQMGEGQIGREENVTRHTGKDNKQQKGEKEEGER
jgi:hypothetical protein